MSKHFYMLLVALSFMFVSNAQNYNCTEEDWESRQTRIGQMFSRIDMLEDNDAITRTADTIMREMMCIMLDEEFDFGTELDLPNIGCVVSDDNELCMYSWNVSLKDANGTSQFYALCYNKMYGVTYAMSQGNPQVPNEKGNIAGTSWYGSMYYKITPIKVNDNTCYLLLGYSPINLNRHYKIIDVMTCTKRGVKFGANIFMKADGKKYSRIVFEYGRDVKMNLEMDKRKKKIIFDHLTDMNAGLNGNKDQGPDMSVDAFVLKGGMWVYQSDLNVKNPREEK